MRGSLAALAVAIWAVSLRAEPVPVTAVTKAGRHHGILSVTHVEVDASPRLTKVPWSDIASIHFGDTDVVHTRQGKRVKGTVQTDGWSLKEKETERPLARPDLRF